MNKEKGDSPDIVSSPPAQSKNTQSKTVVSQTISQWSAPLPHPDILRQYENIQPGFANRIITMTETEGAHVREMDKAALIATVWEARLGQIFGFLIGTIAIIAGSITSVMGAPWSGGFIGTTGVIGLVYVFIKGREAQKPPS